MSGIVVGGFGGVLRSSTPTLFALASGIQWFTLGSTFWGKWVVDNTSLEFPTNPCIPASRGVIIRTCGGDTVTPQDKISASAIAGGVGGTFGGLLRKSTSSTAIPF